MPAVSPIGIGWKETVIGDDPETTAAFTGQFETQHAIILDRALDGEFLRNISELLGKAHFVDKRAPNVGTRKVEHPGFAGFYLREALMRPAMLEWLETVASCGPIGAIVGSITRYDAGTEHHLGWHHDVAPGRRLAITVNLGGASYEGGDFEMRRRNAEELTMRYAHSTPGTVLVFRVTKDLEHRVTPVTSGGPRIVFAGWFLSADAKAEGATLDP